MNVDDFDGCVRDFMNDFGFVATYLQYTVGAYDPTTGSNTSTTIQTSVNAILLDRLLKNDGLGTQYGSLIQAGDKQLFIQPIQKSNTLASPIIVDPSKDRIQIGTTIYKIVTSKEINTTAANQVLIELYIRR